MVVNFYALCKERISRTPMSNKGIPDNGFRQRWVLVLVHSEPNDWNSINLGWSLSYRRGVVTQRIGFDSQPQAIQSMIHIYTEHMVRKPDT